MATMRQPRRGNQGQTNNHMLFRSANPALSSKTFQNLPQTSGKTMTVDGTVNRVGLSLGCLLYTSPSPRDATLSRMPSSA